MRLAKKEDEDGAEGEAEGPEAEEVSAPAEVLPYSCVWNFMVISSFVELFDFLPTNPADC